MKMKLKKIYDSLLNENLNNYFIKVLPNIEQKLNIKIINILGESSGIAYLTNDNKVLKITSAKNEIILSKQLLKTPNMNFPKIYSINLLNDGWYYILKEYINKPKTIEKTFYLLEKDIDEWFDMNYEENYESFSQKLIEIKNDNEFFNYLEDLNPKLIKLYKDMVNIVNFASPLVGDEIDIHSDNIGYNGNNFILFDY